MLAIPHTYNWMAINISLAMLLGPIRDSLLDRLLQ